LSSSTLNVLQVSVRLSEGGAAGVARTIASELTSRGMGSAFAYGYGPHGLESPLADEFDSTRLTARPIAALNQVSYSLRGKDTNLQSPKSRAEFRNRLRSADVVHLHIIHSYFIGIDTLVDELLAAGKPVVWTLHDQWAMTGRCAQPGDCRLWASGCQVCPSLTAYPPAKIDRAARRWSERRDSIERLRKGVPTALVACANWLQEEAIAAHLPNVVSVRNSVDREFWSRTSHTPRSRPLASGSRNLFVCRDLRDPVKIDWDLLQRVAETEGQSLTIVGDDAPRIITGAEFVPAISERSALADVYAGHDRLLFTSKVDYYPLTIAEAITAGVEVFAIRSRAAEEFQGNPLLRIFDNSQEMLESILVPRAEMTEDELSSARGMFDPTVMADAYVAIYRELLAAKE